MQKQFLRYSYLFTNIAFYPLILISNHSELAAKYLQNDTEKSIKTLEISNTNKGFLQSIDTNEQKNFFIAENTENIKKESVLISEIIIEGWENHPEGRKSNICEKIAKS